MMDVDGPRALPMLISLNSLPAYQIECSVPAATWRAVKVCDVLQEEREESLWLKQFGMAGIFACHHSNLAGVRNMHLLLKSSAQANAISTELMAKGRHLERDDNHTTGWTHFTSDLNLAYIDYICSKPAHLIPSLLQVSPLAATHTNYMHEFLQYKDYPPQEPCSMEEYPPIGKNQLLEMEVITFEGSWLLDRLRQEPTSPVPLDMHCLEALIFAHKSQAQKWQPFAVPMYPTDGPIDAIIRQLAWWAFDKMILEGKTPEQEVCPVESFSCQENIGVLCWKSTYQSLVISMTPAKVG